MDDDVAIKVSGVSKKFSRNLKSLMKYGFYDIGRSILGMGVDSGKLRRGEFWAVDDVSFELRRGETLGIIGSNGSGKSTMLKMLNGIYMPDKGKIEINGRVGALIEVGAGFHPMLTGRENIYVNGAILGMGKKEIDEKFDDIVAFADIGDFLDSPVRNYSSGMYVRLGFAIAIHCEPEILLVDEILAVGDFKFQKKCFEKLNELKNQSKSIILVSHNLLQIETFCDRCVFLNKGRVLTEGSTKNVLTSYVNYSTLKELKNEKHPILTVDSSFGTGEVTIKNICFYNNQGDETNQFFPKDGMAIFLKYSANKKIFRPNFIIVLNIHNSIRILSLNTKVDNTSPEYIEGDGVVKCNIKTLPLLPNIYSVDVFIKDDADGVFFDSKKNMENLVVKVPMDSNLNYRVSGDMGVVPINAEWNYL